MVVGFRLDAVEEQGWTRGSSKSSTVISIIYRRTTPQLYRPQPGGLFTDNRAAALLVVKPVHSLYTYSFTWNEP
jgi:hypothetical protein